LMLKIAMMGFLKDQSLGFVAFEWRIWVLGLDWTEGVSTLQMKEKYSSSGNKDLFRRWGGKCEMGLWKALI
jgi:hypothetical protein